MSISKSLLRVYGVFSLMWHYVLTSKDFSSSWQVFIDSISVKNIFSLSSSDTGFIHSTAVQRFQKISKIQCVFMCLYAKFP